MQSISLILFLSVFLSTARGASKTVSAAGPTAADTLKQFQSASGPACWGSIDQKCKDAFEELWELGDKLKMKGSAGKDFEDPADIQKILDIRDKCVGGAANLDGSKGDIEWTLFHGVFQMVLYNRYVEVPKPDGCFLRVVMEKAAKAGSNFRIQTDLGPQPKSPAEMKDDPPIFETRDSKTGKTVWDTTAANRQAGIPTMAVIGAAMVPVKGTPEWAQLTKEVVDVAKAIQADPKGANIPSFFTMSGGHNQGIPLLAEEAGKLAPYSGTVSVTPRAGIHYLHKDDLIDVKKDTELMGFWGRTWGDDSPGLSFLSDAAIIAGIPFVKAKLCTLSTTLPTQILHPFKPVKLAP